MNRKLLLTCVAAMVVAGAMAASPALAAPAADPVDYVALGDSYSSGVGTRSYDGTSGDCKRSNSAYPVLWKNSHPTSSFAFTACSGATTANIPAQAAPLNAGTDLVTLSIGGNDAGFASILTTCQIGSDSDCTNAINNATAFARNQLPARLDSTYQLIRSKAPSAKVVVIGYPRLFETPDWCGFGGIAKSRRIKLNAAADELSGITAGRVSAAGFTYIDLRTPFAGHGICASSEWLNGLSWPIVESYHPNTTGHRSGYLAELNRVTG